MFKSSNYTASEKISLAKEIALLGVQATPLTSLLLAKGAGKAISTVHSWREKTLDTTSDISFAEGSETTTFQESARAELSNYLEIFKKGASVSGTALAMGANQLAEEVADRLLEIKINIENKLINGEKDDGSSSPYVRKLGGLIEWADSGNVIDEDEDGNDIALINEYCVIKLMLTLWNQNLVEGNYYALINATLKEQLDDIYRDNYGYAHREDNFGLVVNSINTNYGVLNFVLSKHVPENKVIVFNDNYLKLVYLREPHFEPLAKTGDSVKGQVIAEATLQAGSKKAIAVLEVNNS
ncbi:MAG: DUF5309 domain-containing protein [Bacteroidales bacterium]|nr:DUF5309 domain-containing protein [Bacteroidales bacterium]